MPEATRGFALGAAYAGFAEARLGSIAVGKTADLTVFDADVFLIKPGEIPSAKVAATLVDGRFVYGALPALR